jgi:hypothetical protein
MMVHFAAPIVDWAALGKAAAAALVTGVGVTGAFSIAVLGATRSTEMRRGRRGTEAGAFAVLGLLGAAVCVAAIVGGIIVMASK